MTCKPKHRWLAPKPLTHCFMPLNSYEFDRGPARLDFVKDVEALMRQRAKRFVSLSVVFLLTSGLAFLLPSSTTAAQEPPPAEAPAAAAPAVAPAAAPQPAPAAAENAKPKEEPVA